MGISGSTFSLAEAWPANDNRALRAAAGAGGRHHVAEGEADVGVGERSPAVGTGQRRADPGIACATERVRIGPLVTPLSRRRVHKLARETVTLDRLSGGRLTVGAGLGVEHNGELEPFGEVTDPRARAELLDRGPAVDVPPGADVAPVGARGRDLGADRLHERARGRPDPRAGRRRPWLRGLSPAWRRTDQARARGAPRVRPTDGVRRRAPAVHRHSAA
ncbi:MAG: LLM class flavin-dependent oxidoreductase [Solirubrobacterales bacterium]|nr:LLM class flavin-dependent oxidoreductase [Solirubrobacterales bacterium]